MKNSYAVKNTVSSLLVEFIAVISGIILPRFFTETYGSSVNGLVSSIGNFITYLGLVEAGVSAAATVELYKPLANNDHDRINEILSSAKGFYYRSGLAFLFFDALLIIGYPLIVKNEIADASFIRMMILALSISGIVDYFVLGKYRVLLVADQKTYLIAIAQCVGTVVTLISSLILIKLEVSSVIVKAVTGIVYILRTLYLVWKCRKMYGYLDFSRPYSSSAFPQRKSALFHQVVGMICNNTDIALLTVMIQSGALFEVSVYSAYNLVAANLTTLFNSISKGVSATFGSILAKEDETSLQNSFNLFELMYFILLFIVYTCMGVFLYSFIVLYTQDYDDASLYPRIALVVLFTACGIVQNIRVPGSTVQVAAGHFKQTQGAALIEAILNFGVSVALVRPIGIRGVLIGTLAAYLFRSTYVIIYNANHFLHHTLFRTTVRFVVNLLLCGAMTAFGVFLIAPMIHSWLTWIVCAVPFFIGVSIVFVIVNYLIDAKNMKGCFQYARRLIRK